MPSPSSFPLPRIRNKSWQIMACGPKSSLLSIFINGFMGTQPYPCVYIASTTWEVYSVIEMVWLTKPKYLLSGTFQKQTRKFVNSWPGNGSSGYLLGLWNQGQHPRNEDRKTSKEKLGPTTWWGRASVSACPLRNTFLPCFQLLLFGARSHEQNLFLN